MPTRHLLQQCAIAISLISLFYNAAEAVVSIIYGTDSSSRALVFYGLQSAVEVISDLLVTWRFLSVRKSADRVEADSQTSPQIIRIERISTTTIGILLVSLTFAAIGTSIASLKAHDYPSTTLPALIIAATSTGIMLLLYLAKRYLARALNSSALHGEALCTLCCMELSIVLLVGSLIYMVWKGGWWIDATTAMVISILFGWEGIKAVRWARNKDFDGGCCGDCRRKDTDKPASTMGQSQIGMRPSTEAEKPKEPEESPCTACTQCCGSKNVEDINVEQV